jgi:hypothetical protein
VREIRTGDPAHGSFIEFEFHVVHLGGAVFPIEAELLSVVNSRGQPGMDEAGSKLESGTRGSMGRLSPGILFRRSGPPRIAVLAADLSLAPGSEFVLRVKSRAGR